MIAARVLRVRGARAWLLAFTLLGALSALFVANRTLLNQRQAPVALSLLMVVLLGSVTGGRLLGHALAFTGFLVINYWFQTPYGTLGVHDPADWVVLVTFVLTGDLASRLIARAERQAEATRRRSAEVQRLADLGAETLATPQSIVALQSIADMIAQTLQLDRCELWEVSDADARRVATSPTAASDDVDADDERLRERVRTIALAPVFATREEHAHALEASLRDAPTVAFLPLHAHGHSVGVLRLVRFARLSLDESKRTFLEALAHYAALGVERARTAEELRRAFMRQEADRFRDFLLASVSHDLRTPLTTITLLAQELAVGGDRKAAMIEEQARRLTRMVDDLLDLSRARAGALPLAPEINTAEDVVGATLRHADGVLRGRHVETSLSEQGGPLLGRFDFVATLRILGNLLENAVKYSPPLEPIRIEAVRDGDALALSVHDRGAGVPVEDRERIFAPFQRASGVAPDVGGSGIGLAVASALAEAQGGSLTYATAGDVGSVFTLRVPAVDGPSAEF